MYVNVSFVLLQLPEQRESYMLAHHDNMSMYPLIPHFYKAKLGFAGFTYFSYCLLENIDCEYSLKPPRRGGSKVYP